MADAQDADLDAGDPAAVRRCFEAIPAVVWLFEGADLIVTAANRAARASVGDRPGIVGRSIRQVIPEMEGQHIFDMIDQCFGQNRVVVGNERRALVDRDGDGRLEEGFFTYTFTPTHHADATVCGVLAHVLDVTEQVLARRAVEDQATSLKQRYQAAAALVLTLQRHLLPDSLPVLPRVRLAARYLVASDELAAGGDWFDAVDLGGGHVGLLVGDVVGHGAQASATMGQLRTVGLQALSSGGGVEGAVAALDAFARRVPTARAASVCVADLDSGTGGLRYVCRAHPPPLVVSADGDARFLAAPGSAPLGVDGNPVPTLDDRLRAGDVLLLFSDGLVERVDQPLDERLAALAKVTSAAFTAAADTTLPGAPADLLCAAAVERMGWLGYADDVTVLAAELLAEPVAPLRLVLPATVGSLRTARRACADWLAALGVDEQVVVSVQHALGEALTNAVEHGCTEASAEVRVSATVDDSGLAELVVTDHGDWRPAPTVPGNRGRGLTMMRSLADTMDVTPSPTGTIVRLCFRLTHATVFSDATNDTTSARLVEPEFATSLRHGDAPVLVVSGPVDAITEQALRKTMLSSSRGGALPLTLDLTEVTHLASAGVQLLHEFNEWAIDHVIAPPHTPAHQILALTGLGHIIRADDN
jgi:anti-anti-sigma factor